MTRRICPDNLLSNCRFFELYTCREKLAHASAEAGMLMPKRNPTSVRRDFISSSVVSPKLRISINSSSVRETRSRSEPIPSDSRQLLARTESFRSESSIPRRLSRGASSVRTSTAAVVTFNPGWVYPTNGLRCLRRILAASTR